MAYYAVQETKRLDADSLGRRARVQHLLGEVADQRGDLTAALASFKQAYASTAELLKRWPNSPQRMFDHSQSAYWVGYIAWRRGQTPEAKARFTEYMTLARKLVAIDPKNDDWQGELRFANRNLGVVLFENGKAEAAAAAFSDALRIDLQLVGRAPTDRDRLGELGQDYAWNADAQLQAGRLQGALQTRLSERNIYLNILKQDPNDLEVKEALVVNRLAVSRLYERNEDYDGAIAELELAESGCKELIKSVPKNVGYQEHLVLIYQSMGSALIGLKRYDAASRSARRASQNAERLLSMDPTVAAWSGPGLGGARLLEVRANALAAKSPAEAAAAVAPSVAEFDRLSRLARRLPNDRQVARIAAEAALMAGDSYALSGNAPSARETWSRGLRQLKEMGIYRKGEVQVILEKRQFERISDQADFREYTSDYINLY